MTGLLGALVLTALIAPQTATAQRFHGVRYFPNGRHTTDMPIWRGKKISVRLVRRVFAVSRGSEMYACSRHSRTVVGCDFAFTSVFGNYTCGNALIHAYRVRILGRYSATTVGCGDF